jgi:hypothetical protein
MEQAFLFALNRFNIVEFNDNSRLEDKLSVIFKHMSSLKWILIVIVLLGIGAGGYWLMGGFSKKEVVDAPIEPVATTTPVTAKIPKPGILTSPATDITDSTLDSDMKLIDEQISGLNTDSKALDAGINDKAIAQ